MKSIIKAWMPPAICPFVDHARCVLRVIRASKKYKSKTYYPDAEKKSHLKILWELIVTAWKWGRGDSIEKTYFAFGLDCKDRDLRDYVFLEEFGMIKDALNSYSFDYNTILNNKIITNILLRSWNLPVPRSLGSIEKQDGFLYLVSNGHGCLLKDYIRTNNVECFCKPLAENGGRGVFHLEVKEASIFVNSASISWDDFENCVAPPMALEEIVHQHESLSALHPQSVNTIRIITVKVNANEIHILAAIQRIGCGGKRVDNWASGGIIIPVSKEGFLANIGYFKPGFGFKVNGHPDTHITFSGYRIPFFLESLELVKRAHSYIGDIHSIGWDIGITPEGPIIIEANGDWDTLLPQVFHGMRKEFENLFVKRYSELNIIGY
jgi:hypothetical protein